MARTTVPRTRGDGPDSRRALAARPELFPAHAGMDRFVKNGKWHQNPVPRTRGDGPKISNRTLITVALFPAHAGMDRLQQ